MSRKILFLEDEKILVDNLPELLKNYDIEVDATSSIKETLEWFKELSYDLVLLDVMMSPDGLDIDPEKVDYGRTTGVEVLHLMRHINSTIPIIIFSVVTDPEILHRLTSLGATKIVHKPIEIDELANTIKKYLVKK